MNAGSGVRGATGERGGSRRGGEAITDGTTEKVVVAIWCEMITAGRRRIRAAILAKQSQTRGVVNLRKIGARGGWRKAVGEGRREEDSWDAPQVDYYILYMAARDRGVCRSPNRAASFQF